MIRQTTWMIGALAAALWISPAAAQTSTGTGSSGSDSSSPSKNQDSRNPGSYSNPTSNGVDSTHQKADPSKAPASAADRGTGTTGTSAAAGSDTSSAGTTSGTAPSSATAASSGASASDTAETLSKLHAGNQAEVQAGRWMQQHATNGKVKDFAKKMVDDHGKMDKDVMSLAQKKGVDLTSTPPDVQQEAAHHQAMLDDLKATKGSRADRSYIDMMVQDHEKDVSDTRDAEQRAKSANDKDLASLLGKSAKTMEGHLKDAQKIQRDLSQRQARTPSSDNR